MSTENRSSSDPVDLSSWVGRRRVRVDWINPNHLGAWNATLDRDDAFPKEGDPVPPGFHWALFMSLTRQSELGPDGHERRGDFLPPVELPRRMWAGSRLRFHQPLRVGERVEKVSVVERIEGKRGRAGALVFVTVRHTVAGAGGLALEEEQDLVYRDSPGAPSRATPLEPAPSGVWRRQIVANDVLLFRYSALTFNGHRIHYDRRYATEHEGYPGLVVHGPLLATLLLDLLRRELPTAVLERFRFKAVRPVFDTSPFTVQGAPGDSEGHFRLWSTDNLGQVGVEAEAWTR
jgi:3-methylfumaryl-CoA hydratase